MSVREMEAMAVGLETMDFDMVRHGPEFIEFMAKELEARGVPVVTPAGGLGCHVDAGAFCPVPQTDYTAGALASAIYIASGARGWSAALCQRCATRMEASIFQRWSW